jgi:hypothetical protein
MTPHPPDPWRQVSAARLPSESVAALAPVRDREDVRVLISGATAWVRWRTDRADVIRCLLPVPGVAFFSHRDGMWFPFGCLVPTSEAPPDGDGLPVAAVISPKRFEPLEPEEPTWEPVALTIMRGGEPKQVSALGCAVGDLVRWADGATTTEIGAVRAARTGDRALLLGTQLPVIPTATRYWGEEVLVPVGFRPEPDLPEARLREAAGAEDGEVLLLDQGGAEIIPLAAFEPLTRAGVRLGARPS